jgi:membrane-associated phospholipid phosphatase
MFVLGGHSAAQTTISPALPQRALTPSALPWPAAPSPVSPSPEGLTAGQSPGHPGSPAPQQAPDQPSSPPTQQAPTHPEPHSKSKPSLERELLKNILRDQRAIWTWPLQIRGEQARWLVPLAGGTAALIATDRYTAEDAGEFNNDSSTHQSITKDVSYIGYVYGVAGVAGSFYLAGRFSDNPRARETGLLVAEAAADGTIVAQVLKFIAQRPRPGSDSGHGAFFDGGSSFPSGHSTVAWAMAAVIAHEYKGHRWVAISAYGIAALVAAARFGAHEHFLSDVLIGSAIGYGIGTHVYNAHHDPDLDSENSEPKSSARWLSTSRIALAPCYNPARREYGLTASVKF